jgi:cyanate lyase
MTNKTLKIKEISNDSNKSTKNNFNNNNNKIINGDVLVNTNISSNSNDDLDLKKKDRKVSQVLDHEKILDLYDKQSLSCTQIAEKLGYLKQSVWAVISKTEYHQAKIAEYRRLRQDILTLQHMELSELDQLVSREIRERLERDPASLTSRELIDLKGKVATAMKTTSEQERLESDKPGLTGKNIFLLIMDKAAGERKAEIMDEVIDIETS